MFNQFERSGFTSIAERLKSTKHCKIHIETMIFGMHMDPQIDQNLLKNRFFGYLVSRTRFGSIFDRFWGPKMGQKSMKNLENPTENPYSKRVCKNDAKIT